MEEKELKTVKQVFKDYDSNSFALSEAKVVCVNIYKKTNTLEIKLKVTSTILMKDLTNFEKYLNKRFGFKQVDIKIDADESIETDFNQKIEAEWKDIVEYMAYKHPLTKALLKNSTISIQDNKIIVKLAMKGKAVLEARGFDKILATKLKDLYHKNYVVTYQEEITEEMIEKYHEHARELEKQAILLAQKEAQEQALENAEANPEQAVKGQAKPTGGNSANSATSSSMPMPEAPIPEEPKEETPLIYGRSLTI